MTRSQPLRLEVAGTEGVAARLDAPERCIACYVFAHGAGAGMQHRAMQTASEALLERGIATLRFQFPYMERGSKRTDAPPLCHATVRAAVAQAARQLPGVKLIAGGRSFGGRMTSQAQAIEPLAGVKGLLFLGYPLHPAGEPGTTRAEHLVRVRVPMLFIQGDADKLALPALLAPLIVSLAPLASLKVLGAADHAFHVPVRSGRTDAQVLVEATEAAAQWVGNL